MKKLSLVLALTMALSSFSGLTAMAKDAVASTGKVLYSTNFEADSEPGNGSGAWQHYASGAYTPYSTDITPLVKAPTTNEPSSLGNKYIKIGENKNEDFVTGDTGARYGAKFSEAVSGGKLVIEFDAKVEDTAQTGEYMNIGITDGSANAWIFCVNPGVKKAGVGLTGNVNDSVRSIVIDEWQHYIVEADLTNSTVSIEVGGIKSAAIDTTSQFNLKNRSFIGFLTHTINGTNMSIDNMVITHNPVSKTVYLDTNFEDGQHPFVMLASAGTLNNLVEPTVENAVDAKFGENTIYDGFEALGNKVYAAGHSRVYPYLFSPATSGVLEVDFDLLVGNGGFGIFLGANSNGGGLSGRFPFVYPRAQRVVISSTRANFTDWCNSDMTEDGETPYFVDGATTKLTYIKDKWQHINLSFDMATGMCVATIDGVKSQPMDCSYIKTTPITSIGFVFSSTGYGNPAAPDNTAYLDNLKITQTPDTFDIKEVDTRTNKLLLTMKKNVGAVTAADVSLDNGAIVTDVETEGNKLLVTATGMVDGAPYVVTLKDTVKYADDSEIANKTYYFNYKKGDFTATQVLEQVIKSESNFEEIIYLQITPSLEDKTVDAYVAAYPTADSDQLIGVDQRTFSVSKFDFDKRAIRYTVPSPLDAKLVKMMTWNEDLVPYCAALPVTVE